MDNQEDGDLDPYVYQSLGGYSYAGTAPTRTVMVSSGSSGTDAFNTSNSGGWVTTQGTASGWRCFRRRGLQNISGNSNSIFGDTFIALNLTFLSDPSTGFVLAVNQGYPDQVATTPVITYVREPIWITGVNSTTGFPRMRKGTLRWMMLTQGATVNQTTDGMKWLVLSSTVAQFVVGPWDGVSTPTF